MSTLINSGIKNPNNKAAGFRSAKQYRSKNKNFVRKLYVKVKLWQDGKLYDEYMDYIIQNQDTKRYWITIDVADEVQKVQVFNGDGSLKYEVYQRLSGRQEVEL